MDAVVLKAGEGERLQLGDISMIVKEDGARTRETMGLVEIEVPPHGTNTPPAHIHHSHEEGLYSGTIIISDFKIASQTYSNNTIDRNFQLTVYQMAVKANGYRDREVRLRFDCLVKTKGATLRTILHRYNLHSRPYEIEGGNSDVHSRRQDCRH